MTEPRSLHDQHDPTLIAAHAAGDLNGRDLDAAARLLAECEACAELHADLRAVARATAELPAPMRSRDFRLSADDAARLRTRGWRRVLEVVAGPRFALAQPLGAALATLGLAGLLLVALPGVQLGGATRALAPATDGDSAGAPAEEWAPGAPAGEAPGGEAPGGEPRPARELPRSGGDTTGRTGVDPLSGGAEESFEPVEQVPDLRNDGSHAGAGDERDLNADAELAQRAADTTLAILSGSFLIVGIGLFGLRWTARRLGDG